MPFWPEALFLLSDRDRQVTWLDPVIVKTDNLPGELVADIQLNYVVPQGRALLLQSVHVFGGAGAGQTCTYIEIALDLPGSPGAYTYLSTNYPGSPGAPAVGVERQAFWSGSVLVPERWRVAGAAGFNAAAQPNQVVHSVVGLLLPMGNIARI
jgi:hypothetical protein